MKREDNYTMYTNDAKNALLAGRLSVFYGAEAIANNDSDSVSGHIDHIVNLNVNQIWTTISDCVIENTVSRKLNIKPTVVNGPAGMPGNVLDSSYAIYKLNGLVGDAQECAGELEVSEYLEKQSLLLEALKKQLVLDTFLFVDYGFDNDLVLNALREVKKLFPVDGKIHYRFQQRKPAELQKAMDLESQYYEEEYNVRTIWVDKSADVDEYLQKIYHGFCEQNVFIAGSFRQLKDNEERKYVEKLVGSLIEKLTANGFRIYSGNGRGLGEMVVAQIGDKQAANHFVNRPLIFTGDSPEAKKHKNELIMKDCSTMIVLCGQDDSLTSSKNVMAQFLSFMENDNVKSPLVIPIPTTGYAAEEIYCKKEFRESLMYSANEEAFEKLENPDIDNITNVVMNLIRSCKGGF